MRTRRERWHWLFNRIAKERCGVDVLYADFVDEYAEATGAKLIYAPWGAHWCRTLSSDLAEMSRCGYLRRRRVGLSGNWQPGFPKWVWRYEAVRDEITAAMFPGEEKRNVEVQS